MHRRADEAPRRRPAGVRHSRRGRGRQARLRAVLPTRLLLLQSGRDIRGLAGRDVVPRRRPRGDRRRVPLHPLHENQPALRRRCGLRAGADRALPGPHGELRQRRAVRPGQRCLVGDGVPERRTRAPPPEPALRGGAGGHRPVHDPGRRGAHEADRAAARHHRGDVLRRLRHRPDHRRAVPRARRVPRVHPAGPHDGADPVGPDDRAGLFLILRIPPVPRAGGRAET